MPAHRTHHAHREKVRVVPGSTPVAAAGLWWAVDMVAFWGGLIAGGALATWGFTEKGSNLT